MSLIRILPPDLVPGPPCIAHSLGADRRFSLAVFGLQDDTDPVRISVAGAGLIGRRHVDEVAASSAAELAPVVDPDPAAAGP
jgi:hypothetical protein